MTRRTSGEGQERGELLPVRPPEPHDRRVAAAPPLGERVERGAGGGLIDGGVDRSQGLGQRGRGPVPFGGIPQRGSDRCTTQVCTTSAGQVRPIASGRPVSPSQQTMHTSATPRDFSSDSTESQNFPDSPVL